MTEFWTTRGRAHLLGDNIPHDGGVINFNFVTARVVDPNELIPHLFDEVDPTLKERLRPGDFIVAGKNFLCGKAHNQGLIALKALGIRILCESMPYRSFRAAIGLAVPVLADCADIGSFVGDGDEIEVAFDSGRIFNITRNQHHAVPPISPDIKVMIEEGGMRGLLAKYLADHPELADA